jgi:sterol desaturase/sphingolipid hydroxylase (fatty acid hydroxylase superfamily)
MEKIKKQEWNYHPKIPIENNPLFAFPLRLKQIIKWYIDMWVTFSETVFCLIVAMIYLFLLPPIVLFKNFNFNSILIIYLFNITIMLVVAGGLHLFFYTLKKQDDKLKYDLRSFSNNKKFTFNKQVFDNMFWSLVSGVTIWTFYQILLLWSYSNGFISKISLSVNPFLFFFLFFIIIFFESIHFYFVHRLLHFKFFYKLFHHIHHRNINPGPWSGISMHPFEHLFYFSTVLIHFIIPSHPIHILFHFMIVTIGAVVGHCGFDGFLINKKNKIALGHFHHQLHHRYFECNYGTIETPIDVLFKSFHDGTSDTNQKFK